MRTVTVFFLLVIAASLATADWAQTNGPVGSATCFAHDGTYLYAGTFENGVFRSTNGGSTWTAASDGLANVYSLAVSGANLFAGTYCGVYLSTNNGTSWALRDSGLTYPYVRAFAISGTNVLAGTSHGVFLSTDNGTSWTQSGLTNTSVYALAVSPNGAGGTNLFAGTTGGVFLSTNNGTGWTQVNSGLTSTWVNSLVVSSTNLFAGTWDGVFLSTNNGTNWSAAGLTNIYVDALAVSGTELFAGTYGGVYLSTNNGTSWIQSNLTNATYALQVSNMNLFAGTGCGVYVSADNGSSWTAPLFTGATGSGYVSALAVNGPEIFAGIQWSYGRGRYGGAGIFHSTDNGISWVSQLADVVAHTFVILGNDVYAGTLRNGVRRSTNNGTSWSPANMGLPYDSLNGYPSVLAFGVLGTNLFAGTDGSGVFLSTNNGTSWSPANTGLPYDSVYGGYPSVVAFGVSDTNLFAGTGGRGVFVSTNNGWTRVNTGLTDTSVLALAVLGTDLFAGIQYSRSGGVFRSTNNGTSWSQSNTGLPHDSVYGYYPGITAFAVSGTNLFAGTGGRGVFLSTNNGTNWASVNTRMTDNEVSTLAASGTYLFAGTGGCDEGCWGTGLWKRPLSEMITSVPPAVQLPRDFVLEQNYPNPFNPTSTIRYGLPHSSYVTLTVYNTLGQQVAQLVNEQQQAGYHDVVFRGNGVASGVYFYRLEVGGFVETKKLIILR